MIVGGLMIGTPLIRYVVPTACTCLSPARKKSDADETGAAGAMAQQPAE